MPQGVGVALFGDVGTAIEACGQLSGVQADGRKLELVLMSPDNHISFSCKQVRAPVVFAVLLSCFVAGCEWRYWAGSHIQAGCSFWVLSGNSLVEANSGAEGGSMMLPFGVCSLAPE
jgi:hypothetical protein